MTNGLCDHVGTAGAFLQHAAVTGQLSTNRHDRLGAMRPSPTVVGIISSGTSLSPSLFIPNLSLEPLTLTFTLN